jgi:IclR family mhp operon transcriptional activator
MATAPDDLDDDAEGTEGDSVRPIRALMRGLEALQEMNRHNGATVTDIAKAVRLPRTTAYRVLETLCVAGYALRDPADDQYRLTLKVRSLSDGFDDEAWVRDIAKPLLTKLGKEVVWPLAISTLHGTSMLVRDTTDKDSPLALERYSAGFRVPVLGSSSGRVHLAFCSEEQRTTLLDVLSRSERPEDKIARDRALVTRILGDARKNGWALFDNPTLAELNLAVPVFAKGRVLAGIVMRFIRSAMTPDQAVEKYVPFMKRTADEIGKAFDASSH